MELSKLSRLGSLRPTAAPRRATARDRERGGGGPGVRVSLSADAYLRYLERALWTALAPQLRALAGDEREPAAYEPGDSAQPHAQARRLLAELAHGYTPYRAQRAHLTDAEALQAFQRDARAAVERGFRAALRELAERHMAQQLAEPAEEVLERLLVGIEALGHRETPAVA